MAGPDPKTVVMIRNNELCHLAAVVEFCRRREKSTGGVFFDKEKGTLEGRGLASPPDKWKSVVENEGEYILD